MAFTTLLLLSVIVPNIHYCQSSPPTDPYVYVLVWRYYYPQDPMSSAISTYKQDLENAGFSVELKFRPYLPDNAEDIRALLQNEALTHEIVGVLLVGDVPYANYKIDSETFPCDLYYMDLDGNWTDSNYDGVYDMHTNETGDLEPEIWIGRLWASTINGDEDELLINYFYKNHRFRTGNLTLPRRALIYIDNELVYSAENANNSLSMIYGNEITLVTDPNTTNATDYKNRLNDTLGYEWLHLAAHGNYRKHAFDSGDAQTDVLASDIRNIDPHVFFYNILACDTADYTCMNFSSSDYDYIGGSYVFTDDYGLLVVGSTKKHHIWNVSDFYEPIAKGKCIGQALKEWLEKNGELNRYTAYGLTILGDPTLRTPRIYNQTRDVAITSVTVSPTEVYASWDVITNVTLKNKGIFVETVNITVYYDNNTIEKQTINLFPEADRTLIFIWDTTGIPSDNYTIGTYVTPVPGEIDTTDNTFTDAWVVVTLCDVNGDGKVTGADVGKLDLVYSESPPYTCPPYDKNRPELYYPLTPDITGDGKVTGADVSKLDLIYSGIT